MIQGCKHDFDIIDDTPLSQNLREISYLIGKTQQTKVNGTVSDPGLVEHGIPQGSFISWPLFLVYVNSLWNGNFKGRPIAFADYTALFYEAESLDQLSN